MLSTNERKNIRQIIADIKGGRAVLLSKGWTRGHYTKSGRCCAAGALQLHTTGDANGTRGTEGYDAALTAQHKIEGTLRAKYYPDAPWGSNKCSLTTWNDHVAKSRNAVVRLFNDTIQRLERELKDDDNARRRAARAARAAKRNG